MKLNGYILWLRFVEVLVSLVIGFFIFPYFALLSEAVAQAGAAVNEELPTEDTIWGYPAIVVSSVISLIAMICVYGIERVWHIQRKSKWSRAGDEVWMKKETSSFSYAVSSQQPDSNLVEENISFDPLNESDLKDFIGNQDTKPSKHLLKMMAENPELANILKNELQNSNDADSPGNETKTEVEVSTAPDGTSIRKVTFSKVNRQVDID